MADALGNEHGTSSGCQTARTIGLQSMISRAAAVIIGVILA
jgi:hypothetical protein